jgi:hypothetical protein
MSKICGFAIKMIEMCPKTEKSLKYALLCEIKTYHCNQNHSKCIEIHSVMKIKARI